MIVFVTGTGTDIGKTIATAALAVRAAERGTVGLCKPLQTGLAEGEPGDVDDAARLSGVPRTAEFYRYPEPLAPETAAARAGMTTPTAADVAEQICAFATGADTTFVEGAGGLLVRLGHQVTLLDVAHEVRARGSTVTFVVVTRAGLGTLSDTELTVDRIRAAELPVAGLVVGAFPAEPDLAARCNVADLPRLTGARVLGTIPAGAGALSVGEFREGARNWIAADGASGL